MSQPYGIVVYGANGSGKTTLGYELARLLGFKHIDHEDYAFEESATPYAIERSHDACIALMLSDIEKHRSFVLSAVTGDFGDMIPQYYELAVYIEAPLELRVERVKQRNLKRFGERVLMGGDMYEQQQGFISFVASRTLDRIEKWSETLTCPILRIDGATDWKVSAASIVEYYLNMNQLNGLEDIDQ